MTQVWHHDRIGVIGSGTMGSGIAQVLAMSGLPVTLIDRTEKDLERGRATIENSLRKLESKGTIETAAIDETLERITTSTDWDALASISAVIEAVFEDLDTKKVVIRAIDEYALDARVIASNTSSISLTALAACSARPEKVVGMHFFNPVQLLPLVEVVRAMQTSDATVEATVSLATRIDKTPVVVGDAPGFVANRLLIPMINEAVVLLEQGVANSEEIDTVMRLGANHPIGPLALADLIGIDVCLSIMEVLHADLGEDRYRPAPLLRRMAAAGRLGRKSGQGFYVYE
jgi:3-hydroxybutyryl-CoA dehydrogenase